MTDSDESVKRTVGRGLLIGFAAFTGLLVAGIALLANVPSLLLAFGARIGKDRELRKGYLLCTRGRFDEACDVLERLHTTHPADSRALGLQAFIRGQQGLKEEALALADRAVETERTAEALATRAQALMALGAWEEALADAEASLQLKPGLFVAVVCAGGALVELRRLEKAIAVLEATPTPERNSAHLIVLAEAYRLGGNHDSAVATYLAAAKRARADLKFRLVMSEGLRAYALAQAGKKGEAEQAILAALSSATGRRPEALIAASLLAVQAGSVDGVLRILTPGVPGSPGRIVSTLADPQFSHLLADERFRRLLAWALGAQRQALERVRSRPAATAMEA